MSNLNKDCIIDLSKSTINISSSEASVLSKTNFNKKKKKIFEVFHKKEIVYIANNTNENKDKTKSSQNVQYKCFYCKNKYKNLNAFESHMKKHVKYNKYIILFY